MSGQLEAIVIPELGNRKRVSLSIVFAGFCPAWESVMAFMLSSPPNGKLV
jgi:hypothetical protein